MKNLTIDNFENDNKTIAVGEEADAMVRRDKAYWDAFNDQVNDKL